MLPESMLWYLLTGKVPTAEEARQFTLDLAQRSEISDDLKKIIDSFRRCLLTLGFGCLRLYLMARLPSPAAKDLHPMTQFVAATAALKYVAKLLKA